EEQRAYFHQEYRRAYKRVYQTYQEKIDEFAVSLQEEIASLEMGIEEFQEFMQALADDPPQDTSRLKEKEVVRRQHADMQKEKEKELLQDMPDGIAYVAMRMRGGRFQPRMKTKQLEPVKEGKRFLNTEEIATLL